MTDWMPYQPLGGRTSAAPILVRRNVHSPQLGNERDLLVCLPPSYDLHPDRAWPVLYLHDGQNLFDPATSFAEEWRADEVVRSADHAGHGVILVAIPNAGEARIDEYSPFHDEKAGGGRGDDYVAFVADTVKPLIDASFRTAPASRYTGIAGSSMGGLISLCAFFRRPDVFGFAGAMSPSLWFAQRAFFTWLEAQPRKDGRIYLDAGTREGPYVLADVARLRDELVERGYRAGRDLKLVLESGGRHDERSWGRRLRGLIEFMTATGHVRSLRVNPAD